MPVIGTGLSANRQLTVAAAATPTPGKLKAAHRRGTPNRASTGRRSPDAAVGVGLKVSQQATHTGTTIAPIHITR
jgi:hypothetical protein